MTTSTRFWQGIRALTAWARPFDETPAAAVLTPEQVALFGRMRRSERLHSLRVLALLREAGHDDPDLWVAALLHDVGKTIAPFHFHERVLVVLVHKFASVRYHRWGQGDAQGWRRPFAISLRHPEWGAELVAAAGGSPRAVELVRRHAEPLSGPPRDETESLLLILQAADDAN
jgi:putative nucleotidyltransferase with HDIG domain